MVPQVSGKVVSIHQDFKKGGFVNAETALVRIDKRDYELAVEAAQAEVAAAKVALDLEKAEGQVAKAEWEQLNPGKEPSSPLVLRQPQIQQAQARLQAAQAQLASAELALSRTDVSLPFDGIVVEKNIDMGQFVAAGQNLGKVYGIDAVEIEVPLEDWELAWFDIGQQAISVNGGKSRQAGSRANVIVDFAGSKTVRQGYVVRTAGKIDENSRMISVVVEVPKPFETKGGRPPLMAGAFAEVQIIGKVLKNAIAVPRYAVHNANSVWVVNNERLHLKKLEIVRSDEEFVYAVDGISKNESIVLTVMDIATEGMEVRIEELTN